MEEIVDLIDINKNTFIENNGTMSIIGYTRNDSKLCCLLPVDEAHWYNEPFADHQVHAVAVDDVYYIITRTLTFRIFDSKSKTIEQSEPFENMNLSFDDLQLGTNKSIVIVLIKCQQKIMLFDTLEKTWSFVENGETDSKIIALTETHIPTYAGIRTEWQDKLASLFPDDDIEFLSYIFTPGSYDIEFLYLIFTPDSYDSD